VHRRLKGVGVFPFCAAAGVKGAVKEAIGGELVQGSYGGGKMNCARLDRVQKEGTGLGQLYAGSREARRGGGLIW
jgi:hypothetical protein